MTNTTTMLEARKAKLALLECGIMYDQLGSVDTEAIEHLPKVKSGVAQCQPTINLLSRLTEWTCDFFAPSRCSEAKAATGTRPSSESMRYLRIIDPISQKLAQVLYVYVIMIKALLGPVRPNVHAHSCVTSRTVPALGRKTNNDI